MNLMSEKRKAVIYEEVMFYDGQIPEVKATFESAKGMEATASSNATDMGAISATATNLQQTDEVEAPHTPRK